LAQKILVVEDTVDTRELVHLYLTREGFEVIIAADGGEGLYHAKSDHPALIITDINMPNLTGIDMIRQLRQEPASAETPIIALTAYGSDFAKEALDAGASATLEKPFDFEAMIAKVRALLRSPSE
jgi:two-component system chemotaxis response regulator CheY